jgi:hypothetical protein
VTAGTSAADAGYRGDAPRQLFASDDTYGVGQCAAGWIPFQATGHLDTIRYDNGVGDEAVWDPEHLSDRPVTRHRQERPPAPSGIGEGTYIVGEDLQPGRYQAAADQNGLCYWARLKDDSGDNDSIIANNATSGRASVTISSSDGAFETSGCTTWVRQ